MTLAFVGLQFALGMPFQVVQAAAGLASGAGPGPAMVHPAILAWVNVLAIGAVIAWGLHWNRAPWHVVLPLRRIPWGAVGAVLVTTAGGVMVLSEVDNLFRRVLPMPEFVERFFMEMFHHPEHAWATALLMVIVAPATEEPLFRGVILRGILGRNGPVRAVLVSSLLFGLAHLNPWQFVSATLLGVVFGWWYLRTRSLLPGLIGHALVNAVVVAAPNLPFQTEGFNVPPPAGTSTLQPLWFDAVGVTLALAGFWLFRRATPTPPAPEPRAEPPPVIAPPPI
ncbi:MAG: CPBP family intramembrane metalloprotease [Verrucomicrobia bacterium]|nr:CPBP family intramembrane metalloprotease [Verrucomicrobiota bacterium]